MKRNQEPLCSRGWEERRGWGGGGGAGWKLCYHPHATYILPSQAIINCCTLKFEKFWAASAALHK